MPHPDNITAELENAVEKGLAQGMAGQPTKLMRPAINGAAMTKGEATMSDVIDALDARNQRLQNDLDGLIAGLQRLREEL